MNRKRLIIKTKAEERKKTQPQEGKEIISANTYNERRKQKYNSMACTGELGARELKCYLDLRAYIFSHTIPSKRPDLPYECPRQCHYDLARLEYRKLEEI